MEYADICPRARHPCCVTCATATGMGGMNSPSTLSGSRLGCCCARPLDGTHVRTIFSQLAFFVHHDLHKFRFAGSDAGLTQVLKLDAFAVPGAGRMAGEGRTGQGPHDARSIYSSQTVLCTLRRLGRMTCTPTFVMSIPEITLVEPYIISTWLTCSA